MDGRGFGNSGQDDRSVTPEDNVVRGYAIHLEDVCVDPRLRALYDELDRAGRVELAAIRADASSLRVRWGPPRALTGKMRESIAKQRFVSARTVRICTTR